MKTFPATLLHLLLFISAAVYGSADDSSPAVLLRVCSPTNASNTEMFDVNFVNVMEMIYKRITVSNFGSAVYGSGVPVYGVAECFGYLSSVNCQLCYAQSRVQLPLCLPSVDGRIYLDGCFLRYSASQISNQSIDSRDTSICSNTSLPSSVMKQFSNATDELMKDLVAAAVNGSGYYKVSSVDVLPRITVYGMVQCWRTLNKSACFECLENGRASIGRCLPADDGKALNAGCYLRYSTQNFYSLAVAGSGGSSAKRIVGIAIGCTSAALFLIALAIFWLRRRRASRDTVDADGSAEFIKSISKSHLTFKYEDLRIATNNFSPANKLGQGGYGSVYKGILPDGRDVAVKRLFFNTRQSVQQFFNEVELINQIQHKNLVKLYGCSLEGPESLLVYEHLHNTSLDHFLFDSFKKNALDWERRFGVIVGTAEGLAYLHNASQVRIIHRDIKASNVLLDENFRPKIADFGLARPFSEDQSHLSTGLAGTLGYMAPEYIMHGQLTEKADIYSYGILVIEIVTGRKNCSSAVSTTGGDLSVVGQVWRHFNTDTLMEQMDPCLREQCNEKQVTRALHVALLCTQASPRLRPPMWKVVEMLTGDTSIDLPKPTQPPFLNSIPTLEVIIKSEGSETSTNVGSSSSTNKSPLTVNQLSASMLQAR